MLKVLNSSVHTKVSVAQKCRRCWLPQIVNPAPVRTAICRLVCFNLTEHLSKQKNKPPCLEGLFKIKLSPATLKIIPVKLQAKFEKHLTWLLANYSRVNLLSAATTTSINTSQQNALFCGSQVVNPLSPNSNGQQCSPNDVHTLLKDKVMRINKMITKGKMT